MTTPAPVAVIEEIALELLRIVVRAIGATRARELLDEAAVARANLSADVAEDFKFREEP